MGKLKVGVVYKEKATDECKLQLRTELRARAYELIKRSDEDHKQAERDVYKLRSQRI
jgi:hypothetical protein